MLKTKFNFNSSAVFKLISFSVVLLLCQFWTIPTYATDDDNGNHKFVRVSASGFSTITLRPDVVAFGDFTNNGYDDIILAENGRNPQFLIFNPDSNAFFRAPFENFMQTNGTTRNLPSGITSNYGPIAILDVTNDGLNDVIFFSSRFGTNAFVSTWRDTIMHVTTPTAGLNNVSFRGSSGVQFGDINNDGKLDLHMTSEVAQNIRNWLVYNIFNQNNQSHNNTNNDDAVRISATSRSNYLFDFNNDGFLDLYVNNGSGQQDEFYRGTSDGFKEMAGHPLTAQSSSWASAIADVTNNGFPDIYRTNPGTNRNSLFLNQGNFEFVQETTDIITLERLDSRAATWADFDNNGRLDLAVAENAASVSMYENLGQLQFQKLPDEPIMNFVGNWRHVIFFDMNQNGKLDILTLGKQANAPVTVYENVTQHNNNWVAVRLTQTNAFYSQAFGAKLRLRANISGQNTTQTRYYNPWQGRFSQHPTPVHFGLGNASSATLEITWPSGLVTSHNLNAQQINQYLHFEEPRAGKLIQVPTNTHLVASLRDFVRDTLYIDNVGMADISISGIENPNDHLVVESYTEVIPERSRGYIAVMFQPTDFDDLQVRTDTLTVLSNAIQGRFPVQLVTDGRTNPAEFSLFEDNDNPLLNQSRAYQKSIWADFSNNGLKDVILLVENQNNRLYLQESPGVFVFQENSIISREGRFSTDGAAGDYNRDGHIDVILTNPDGENYFYKNDGNGNFRRKVIQGISGRFRTSSGVSFYDFNGNGFLDLFITNTSGQSNELLLFRDDSTYVQWQAGDVVNRNNFAVSHLIRDLNDDGFPEIIITNRNTQTGTSFIEFYRGNSDLTFTRIQIPGMTDSPYQAAGVIALDMNGNERPDLLFLNDTGSIPMRMYLNEGDLAFSRWNRNLFDSFRSSPSDVVILDYNLNGFSDIFITDRQFNNPNIFLESVDGPNYIRINAGELVTQTDRASYSASAIDFNDNGRLDLFVVNYFNNNTLFMNESSEHNWLSVSPYAVMGDTKSFIPGTKVRVRISLDGNEHVMTRWIGGQSLFSPVIGPLYFGLGDANSAEVSITFPNGASETMIISEVNRNVRMEIATSSNREFEPEVPQHFAIHQNYPNPFNPITTLHYDIPELSQVRLSVYNSIGQRVRILAEGSKAAGTHEIIFDASQLPSGLYLAVLEANGQQFVQKMMLIK